MDYCYEPIYGAIPIYPHEKSIMSLPFMQKLHRIRQMGLISLVFLGANHTRLEHSVGTMHLAGKMIARVMRNPDLKDIFVIRLAALFHDVGHTPFSHSCEELLIRMLGKTHEDRSAEIVSRNLPKIKGLCKNVLEEKDIKRVLNLVTGKQVSNKLRYQREIVSGTIDSDRLDYLQRDAYYTGVAYGAMSAERLIFYLTTCNFFNQTRLAMFEDGIQEAVSTLVTRDFNYAGIVYNPQVRSVNALLLKAVEHLVQRTSYISIEEFARSDDYSVLAALSKCGKSDPELRKLVDCLISGRLLPYIKAKGAKMINWERLGALNSEFLARLQNLAEKASRADPIDTQRKSLQEFYNFLSQSRQKVEEGLKKKLGCKTIIVDIPPPPKVRELDALMMIKGRSMLLRSAYPALQGVEVSAAKRWSVLAFADVAVTDRTAFEAFEKGVEELETNP